MAAEVIRSRGLSLQVCVPSDWSDAQVVAFAEADTPCGTEHGWQPTTRDDSAGRTKCASRDGHVHIVLDA